MRAISVRLPEWLLEKLDDEADIQGRTRSQMIVVLLAQGLGIRREKKRKKP